MSSKRTPQTRVNLEELTEYFDATFAMSRYNPGKDAIEQMMRVIVADEMKNARMKIEGMISKWKIDAMGDWIFLHDEAGDLLSAPLGPMMEENAQDRDPSDPYERQELEDTLRTLQRLVKVFEDRLAGARADRLD